MVRLYPGFFICLSFYFTMIMPVSAQDQSTISVSYDSASFEEVVRDLEGKTGHHFYYDPAITDSLKFSLSLENKQLGFVLGQMFAGTDMHYAIDARKNIFITKGREIMSDLPPDFFGNNTEPRRDATASFDYSPMEKREEAEETVESRLYNIGQNYQSTG